MGRRRKERMSEGKRNIINCHVRHMHIYSNLRQNLHNKFHCRFHHMYIFPKTYKDFINQYPEISLKLVTAGAIESKSDIVKFV